MSLSGWFEHFLDTMIGSPQIAKSNLGLLASDEKIGILFAQHYPPVRPLINWGGNFDVAKALLLRMGCRLSRDQVLEFPSGS